MALSATAHHAMMPERSDESKPSLYELSWERKSGPNNTFKTLLPSAPPQATMRTRPTSSAGGDLTEASFM